MSYTQSYLQLGQNGPTQQVQARKSMVDETLGGDYDYDQEDAVLANGPLRERSCTDVLCCVIFIICMGGSLYVAFQAYRKGNPYKLAYPYDADRNACGQSAGFEGYPYIYFAKPIPGSLDKTVCVKKCPTSYLQTVVDCIPNKKVTSCKVALKNIFKNLNGLSWPALMKNGDFFVYPSYPLYGRLCMPTELSMFNYIKKLVQLDSQYTVVREYLGDIYDVRWILLYCGLISLVLSLALMIIIRYVAGICVWSIIIIYFVILLFLLYTFWQGYQGKDQMKSAAATIQSGINQLKNTTQSNGQVQTTKVNTATNEILKTDDSNKKYYYYAFIGVLIITAISALLFCCYYRSLKISIAVLKSAALFMGANMQTLVVPIIFYILILVYFMWWILTFLYLYSCGERQKDEWLPFAQFDFTKNQQYTMWYFLFCGFWMIAFLQAYQYFIIAMAVCQWYFEQGLPNKNKSNYVMYIICFIKFQYSIQNWGQIWCDLPSRFISIRFFRHCNCMDAISNYGIYNSIIFCFFFTFNRFQKKIKQSAVTNNVPLNQLGCCANCCLACFARFIKFITEQSYTRIALTGKNFCVSCIGAFKITLSNPVRFAMVSGLGGVIVTVGKAFVAMLTCFIGYYIVKKSDVRHKLISYLFPAFIFCIEGYIIAKVFLAIYDIATEAILQCFLLDEKISKERGFGGNRCPEPLRQFFAKNEGKRRR